MRCVECGKEIGTLDEGLTRKLINRGAKEFLCMECLCRRFDVSEELLREKARQFRRSGCALFPPDLQI